eukprot:gene10903-7561_t
MFDITRISIFIIIIVNLINFLIMKFHIIIINYYYYLRPFIFVLFLFIVVKLIKLNRRGKIIQDKHFFLTIYIAFFWLITYLPEHTFSIIDNQHVKYYHMIIVNYYQMVMANLHLWQDENFLTEPILMEVNPITNSRHNNIFNNY